MFGKLKFFIKINLWFLDWNVFHGQIEIFDFSKTPFRYVFSIAMSVFLRDFWEKVLVSQGCVQSEVTVQTL